MAITIADLWTVEKDAPTFADDFVQITIYIKQILIVLINNKKVNWLQNQLGNLKYICTYEWGSFTLCCFIFSLPSFLRFC